MMVFKALSGMVMTGLCSICAAAPESGMSRQAAGTVAPADMVQWGMGLVLVLALFFACIWMMRKLHGLSAGGTDRLRVVGGLSLGMREKVVVLEVGKKQLVLGVTPGRIETLLVLDESDYLKRDQERTLRAEGAFAEKLMRVMRGPSDA